MRKRENVLFSKQGMTLTELLVALALLMLIVVTFLPLFTTTYRNIYTAGQKTQQTYEKMSLMERLISSKGNNEAGYESSVTNVPLKLSTGTTTVSFGTQENDIDRVSGTVIASGTSGDQYTTFYTAESHSRMICFPTSLTDDFLTTNITLVPKGFDFAKEASNKNASSTGYHFEVHYTPSTVTAEQKANPMLLPKVPTQYYDITYVDDSGYDVAVFTLKGGNNIVSFENSPIVITYSQGTGGADYYASIELGAPEIIFVGDKASDGSYYYYVTSGVDSEGRMDLIARKMTGSSELKSNMNDVEWVSEGRGDDGNGGVNDYGYYVMGGDAGQVRRFWRNNNTGNYYWGGDNLDNYNRRLDECGDASFEEITPTLTTQASFKSIFRGNSDTGYMDASKYNVLVEADKDLLGHKYQAATMNSFTANVTDKDEFYLTVAGAFKKRDRLGYYYEYYGFGAKMSEDEYNRIIGWASPNSSHASKLNMDGYKEAVGYEYKNDDSLITITSVGAVQINKSNPNYVQIQENSPQTERVYPTDSYTLYCGYIPSVTDVYGWKTSNLGGWSKYVHLATIGAAYSSVNDSWYPTGKFGDLYTDTEVLNSDLFPSSYRELLNYYDENTRPDKDNIYPFGDKGSTYYYVPGQTVNGKNVVGQLICAEGMDYHITAGKEVDVTTGYLSKPYAIAISNPTSPRITSQQSAERHFPKFKLSGTSVKTNGGYGHSYTSAGLRDNVTMLDVKSFHDDITDNNISFAVGYSLSYIFNDYNWATRPGQVYNTGLVYIRASGDGSDNDDIGSTASGKGWSLKKETNVFHQFYGTDQYQNDNPSGSTGNAARGWDSYWHRSYANVTDDTEKAPQDGHSPNILSGTLLYGTSTHPMSGTECSTVNSGTTWDEKPQVMWGTKNGSLFSWNYNYEQPTDSKITAVTKEFESYTWADRVGLTTALTPLRNSSYRQQFYDYTSRNDGTDSTYGFVSVLASINDVAYGDGNWVAVGNQSGKAPANYCASDKCYTGNGNAASYINVKYCYDEDNHKYAWKAVKVADQQNMNFISVTYSNGVWYALGYVDKDGDNESDSNEGCVIYYSTDPENTWQKAQTRTKEGVYRGQNPMDPTNALYYDSNGNCQQIEVECLNSMASRN